MTPKTIAEEMSELLPKGQAARIRGAREEIDNALARGVSLKDIHSRLVKLKVIDCAYNWFTVVAREMGLHARRAQNDSKAKPTHFHRAGDPDGDRAGAFGQQGPAKVDDFA